MASVVSSTFPARRRLIRVVSHLNEGQTYVRKIMSIAQEEMAEAVTDATQDSPQDNNPADVGGRPACGWLQDLSNAFQVVGAIAVVASLIYVGLQLRLNTSQLQREESNATQAQWQAIRLTLAGDRDVAQLWVAGLNGGTLDAIDRLRFESLLSEHTWATFHIWDRTVTGVFEASNFERGAGPSLARWLCSPGGAPWWTKTKVQYAPGFVHAVEAAMTRLTPEERANCPAPQ